MAERIIGQMDERLLLVLRLRRKEELSFKEIGQRIGVSGQQASNLYRHAARLRKHRQHWADGLTVRVYNVLINQNIHNRREAQEAFNSGRLHWDVKCRIRNFGKKSYYELKEWLSKPPVNVKDAPWVT